MAGVSRSGGGNAGGRLEEKTRKRRLEENWRRGRREREGGGFHMNYGLGLVEEPLRGLEVAREKLLYT